LRFSALLLASFGLGCSASDGDIFTLRAQPEAKTALPADAFVDSLGVDLRLGWGGTQYTTHFSDWVLPALERLRVRHVRDESVKALTEPANVAVTSRLAAELGAAGVATTWLMDPRLDVSIERVPEMLMLGGNVEAVEGPTKTPYAGLTLSDQELRDYMRALDQAVGALPVLAPAANEQSVGRLEQWVDYAHVDLESTGEPAASLLDGAIALASANCPGRPLIATARGYYTTPGSPGTVVPELVAAKYLLRLWAGNFERRIVRTYLAPLFDLTLEENPELTNQRGLLRADGNEKPAFEAIARLAALLEDPGVMHLPGALAYELEGVTPDLHQVLLSTRSGRFFLVLWLEQPSFDVASASEIDVAPLDLELRLADRQKLSLYTPLFSGEPEPVLTSDRLELKVPDHPIVIAIGG
jgi:hypothetical protein